MNNFYRMGFYLLLSIITVGSAEAQWTQTTALTINVKGLATDGSRIFAGSSTEGIFVSTDDGVTWLPRNSNFLLGSQLRGFNIFGDTIYAYGNSYQKMGVTDTSWGDPISEPVGQIYASGSLVLYGHSSSTAIGRSTDYGSSWSFATINNQPSGGAMLVSSFIAAGSAILAGHNNGIHRSIDAGATWDSVYGGIVAAQVMNFYPHSSGLYAVGVSSSFPMLLRSGDDGVTWANVTTAGLSSGQMTSLTSSGANLYSTVIGRGVYSSTNNGSNWTASSTGLTSPNTSKFIIVKGANAFLGTAGSGVWKRPISELTDVTPKTGEELPKGFSLQQNYPNPFNPETHFQFSISNFQSVSLKIFDVLGREVATLVNEPLQPGTYTRTWDASKAGSGVYFYKLHAGTFSDTKKMLFIK